MTSAIILLWVVSFLLYYVARPLAGWLVFDPGTGAGWLPGLFTYPLFNRGDLITLFLAGFMLYQFGGSLERTWGARTYALFLLAANTAAAIIWQFGFFLLTRGGSALGTPWLLISAVIVAWAFTHPEETILFMFVLPMKAKWIGWLDIAITFFSYPLLRAGGILALLSGIFALGGIAVAAWYPWWRRKWGWIPRQKTPRPSARTLRHPSSSPLAPLLRPFREWQRRRRIAHLQKTIRFDDDLKQ